MVKKLFILTVLLYNVTQLKAQPANCTFKPPFITIHFGTGEIRDLNSGYLANYDRRETSCPRDGYYSYASFTSACFSGDWHTITEDHTPGDVEGNMMLVNGAPDAGVFLRTPVSGFKGNTIYEFGVWLMNLCRPTEKCPFPLLANLTIRLETQEGKVIAQIRTGDLIRTELPHWTQHRAQFTTP
ncbi:MAG TPA: hypothetical protein VGD17_16430, partial [Chitinophagaceae bacterium]